MSPGPVRFLKRWLLPLWNGGHHLAARAGRLASAAARGRRGTCSACGRAAWFLLDRRVMPAELVRRWGIEPEAAEAFVRKESLACSHCGASLRARRLASAILGRFPVGDPPAPAPSVADWVRSVEARRLRVAEINHVAGLHDFLGRLPGLAYSEFRPDAAPGSTVGGVRCEDLTRLTYPDAAFDLVLTSETLEHVPDLPAALAEIRRVLAPGGLHIFTVPVAPGVPETFARSILRPDGSVEHRVTPIAHPGGDSGWPVFTEFGADLPALLAAAGFEVEVHHGPNRVDDVAQVYLCRRAPDRSAGLLECQTAPTAPDSPRTPTPTTSSAG